MHGAFHGVKFDSDAEPTPKKEKAKNNELGIIPFGDPESYKHLSEEERNALTAKMLGPLYNWSKDPMGKKKFTG